MTPNGLSTIESLKEGNKVISFDTATDSTQISTVEKTRVRESFEYYLINETLKATAEHPFAVKTSSGATIWKTVKELVIGDTLIGIDNKQVIIQNIKKVSLPKPIKVYNLYVSDPHNYFVIINNVPVLVHNKMPPI